MDEEIITTNEDPTPDPTPTPDPLIAKAKLALRVTTDAYNDQIADLIASAKLDLGIAGVVLPGSLDAICNTAIITYVCSKFGNPDNYAELKASYDEQKAQLVTCTGYTTWTDQTS